jgi:hypothetical protein
LPSFLGGRYPPQGSNTVAALAAAVVIIAVH